MIGTVMTWVVGAVLVAAAVIGLLADYVWPPQAPRDEK